MNWKRWLGFGRQKPDPQEYTVVTDPPVEYKTVTVNAMDELAELRKQINNLEVDKLNRSVYGDNDPRVTEIRTREMMAAYNSGKVAGHNACLDLVLRAINDHHRLLITVQKKRGPTTVFAARQVRDALIALDKQMKKLERINEPPQTTPWVVGV